MDLHAAFRGVESSSAPKFLRDIDFDANGVCHLSRRQQIRGLTKKMFESLAAMTAEAGEFRKVRRTRRRLENFISQRQ